ncbi:hypothetical protein J4H92_11510 [Leucobacter weissii]|uniref:Uncharacterized protein n=1 Tax=Leucobacter weissii TaxID=1983706 RepID=A0A939S6N6_9MICO|nr:hypothetical protein [Leucobacter weissii]MBO1902574.1 hypothetical protein [Leucobacter weissii]
MNVYHPERAAAVRAQLISHASARRRFPNVLLAILLVVSGALGGAGVAVGAYAVSGGISPELAAEPSTDPDRVDGLDAPGGVIPGTPIISLLGEPQSHTFDDEDLEIDLLPDAPHGATHARVTLQGTAAGTVAFGVDPGGDNPSARWDATDIGNPRSSAWEDILLDRDRRILYLSAAGAAGVATIQFVSHVPTELGVNASGETYGVGDFAEGEPDLVAVTGVGPDGGAVLGYARATDLEAFSPDHPGLPSDPDQATAWQAERDAKYPNGWEVPVYESDGTTEIGSFRVG